MFIKCLTLNINLFIFLNYKNTYYLNDHLQFIIINLAYNHRHHYFLILQIINLKNFIIIIYSYCSIINNFLLVLTSYFHYLYFNYIHLRIIIESNSHQYQPFFHILLHQENLINYPHCLIHLIFIYYLNYIIFIYYLNNLIIIINFYHLIFITYFNYSLNLAYLHQDLFLILQPFHQYQMNLFY